MATQSHLTLRAPNLKPLIKNLRKILSSLTITTISDVATAEILGRKEEILSAIEGAISVKKEERFRTFILPKAFFYYDTYLDEITEITNEIAADKVERAIGSKPAQVYRAPSKDPEDPNPTIVVKLLSNAPNPL